MLGDLKVRTYLKRLDSQFLLEPTLTLSTPNLLTPHICGDLRGLVAKSCNLYIRGLKPLIISFSLLSPLVSPLHMWKKGFFRFEFYDLYYYHGTCFFNI